ncbi:MAG: bifunctional nuclease domain-containing protein [Patescibacteria group bacterium]
MTRKISFLTIVGDTAYFFCKGINYLLPITVTANCISNIISSQNFTVPRMHNTFIRTLNAFGTKISSISLYQYTSNTFLAYIRIKRDRETLDINSSFEDCLVLAVSNDIKILIEERILLERGFFVSKEMVEKALIENSPT